MTVAAAQKIAVLIQGPVYEELNGYSTVDIVRALSASPHRTRLHVVFVVWDTERADRLDTIRPFVDEIVFATQPADWGSGNRNLQRQAINAALNALDGRGFTYVLKTRSDFLLSDALLAALCARVERGVERVLVTNVYTRYEPFHVSDMLLFARFEHVRHWYDPREVYYQDLYSPEVQFARVFVRNMGLPYPMTQQGYLTFLRDWIDLVDFNEFHLVWFKDPAVSLSKINALNWVIYDRDCGPVLTKGMRADYPDYLRKTRMSLAVLATSLVLHDTLTRFILVSGSSFLERVCHLRAYHFSINLPGDRMLELKLGASPRRFRYYSVDPVGREVSMPLGCRPRRPPTTSRTPSEDAGGRVPWLRLPMFAARILRVSKTAERA
ncbi:MAG: hypothetical protein JWM95_4218 [Gemmatimonadetes bacterium]|nr:hypothetical protein [Gemmatimonadota bacterium]